ncbi:MAG: zinc-ribbon domain-containing protein [Chitinivibrionales bacterium]|nr:zinc-ribbon domain-containing protein [Chitinivibrionales bacterium]
MTKKETFTCPNCGETVPYNAKACPYCGSDDETGWSEQTYLDGIDLPDDESYDELLNREFSTDSKSKTRLNWRLMTAAILCIVFILLLLRGLF